jgi:hypothetical protein
LPLLRMRCITDIPHPEEAPRAVSKDARPLPLKARRASLTLRT